MVGRTGPVSHNRAHHHLPVANTVEDHLATVELGFYRLRAEQFTQERDYVDLGNISLTRVNVSTG